MHKTIPVYGMVVSIFIHEVIGEDRNASERQKIDPHLAPDDLAGAALVAAFFAAGFALLLLAAFGFVAAPVFFSAKAAAAIFLAVATLRLALVLLVLAVVMPMVFGLRLLALLVLMFFNFPES